MSLTVEKKCCSSPLAIVKVPTLIDGDVRVSELLAVASVRSFCSLYVVTIKLIHRAVPYAVLYCALQSSDSLSCQTTIVASVNHSPSGHGSLLETAKNASVQRFLEPGCIANVRIGFSVGLGKPSLLGSTVAEKAHVIQWASCMS